MIAEPVIKPYLPTQFRDEDITFVLTALANNGFRVEQPGIDSNEFADAQTVAITLELLSGCVGLAASLLAFWNAVSDHYRKTRFDLRVVIKFRSSRSEYILPQNPDLNALQRLEVSAATDPPNLIAQKVWEDDRWLMTTDLLEYRKAKMRESRKTT